MATKKKTSSGSGPKSKRIVKNKMEKVMHEYKHHELSSGRSGKKVKSRKKAIAIGLSEARRAGGNVPAKKKSTAKKSTAKKSTAKKSSAKKSTAKKGAARKHTTKKHTTKKHTAKKSS